MAPSTRHSVLFALLLTAFAGAGQAQSIEIGETLVGERFEWQRSYRKRWQGTYGQYAVTLEAGTAYEITTSEPSGGNTSDAYLYLLDSSFNRVASDDDSNGSLQAKISYTPPVTGTYYIRLRAYSRGRYGFCSLTVRTPPPPPPSSTLVISPGDTLHDQYFAWESAYSSRSSGSYASYTIEMTAGTPYTFTTSNAYGGNTTDTYLYLVNPGGSVVASDDDSNGNLASRLSYQPSAGGTYTLKLRAYARGTYGYATLAVTSPAQGGGNPQLPDLIVWEQYLRDASIEGSSQKLLRFSNGVPNIGDGHLEMYGIVQPDGTTYAYQRVWNDNGSYTDYLAGTFVFEGHEDHNHWHFAEFADYNLRSVAPDGRVGAIVATSEKVTFCLEDVVRYDPATGSSNYTCDNQGISVGWSDVYARRLEGQWIDITSDSVPSGQYWLESVVDPANRIRETDNANNAARIRIEIDKSTNTVRVLP